ncbi:MAG: hypothetical protein M3Z49_12760, partial [Bifidobacteriales bacterium]|nr:hypothetical protein [Bifidobacteriales bacterium]
MTKVCHSLVLLRDLAHQVLLAEDLVKDQDQAEGLNAHRLKEEWPNLRMDCRVRQPWEGRFPNCVGSSRLRRQVSRGATTAHAHRRGKSADTPWSKGLDDFGPAYV